MFYSLFLFFYNYSFIYIVYYHQFLGPLREKAQDWLRGYGKQDFDDITGVTLMKKLNDFPLHFIKHNHPTIDIVNYDDEDLEIWKLKAKRWAHILFLTVEEEYQLDYQLQVFFL